MESPPFKTEFHDAESTSSAFAKHQTELPAEIEHDMHQHESFLYFAFMFLNASVLWAYFSCLAAQQFYMEEFPQVDFPFLTVMVSAWPMVIGHAIQMLFNVEKRVSQQTRMIVGYVLFMAMGITIMVLSAIDFGTSNTGGYLVLACFSVIGFANSLSETSGYTLAALFPVETFTNAVQIGNTVAGAVNVTLQTIIRLLIGGIQQTKGSNAQSFYLFFALLIVVCLAAMVLYQRVLRIQCVAYLIQRNADANRQQELASRSVRETLGNYWRVFRTINVPCWTIFLVFFVSLSVFPGFGISASRVYQYVPDYPQTMVGNTSVTVFPDAMMWYISPGIIAGYSYGDLIGRIICTAAVYKLFTMMWSMVLTLMRFGYIVLLLMGVYGTTLYVFGDATKHTVTVVLLYEIVITFSVGLSNGVLSTVTMGRAPLMVAPEDREAASSVMVLFLFTGIASGATFGYLISANHWFGI